MAKGAVTVTVLLNAIGAILAVLLLLFAFKIVYNFINPSDSQASLNNFNDLSTAITKLSEDTKSFSTQRLPLYLDDYSVIVGFDKNVPFATHDCYVPSSVVRSIGSAFAVPVKVIASGLTFGYYKPFANSQDSVFVKGAECGDNACLCLYTMKSGVKFAQSSTKASNFDLVSCAKFSKVDKIIQPSYKQVCAVLNSDSGVCAKSSSIKVSLDEEPKVTSFVANLRGKERPQVISEYPWFDIGDVKTKFFADAVVFGHCDSGVFNSLTSSFQSKPVYVEKVKADGKTDIMISGDFDMMKDREIKLKGQLASPDDVKSLLNALQLPEAVETATAILSNKERNSEDQFATLVYLAKSFDKASQASEQTMADVFKAANIPAVLDMGTALKDMAKIRYQWARELGNKCCKTSPLMNELPQSL